MRNSFKCYKVKYIIFAIVISFIGGAFTIEKAVGANVYYFGFPSTFMTINKQIPVSLGINPIQFVGNIAIIWLILFYLFRALRKLVPLLRKKKS